ncbi:hypothetical protein [Bradyrhizobium sp. SZCCHNR2028]|uniref:hypothetical protein n=1 Tax=Bradyrhizobium sp. SZCCHNR2028 TaxID=3057382 RepID=UPI0028E3EFDD|nr:hypothetical protein [Bradyrhizobium sp. SZCCHNR2028]
MVDLLLIPFVAVNRPRQFNLCTPWALPDQKLKNIDLGHVNLFEEPTNNHRKIGRASSLGGFIF